MENKTKRPLLPGDKVKVYGYLNGSLEANGWIATVIENDKQFGPPSGWLTVAILQSGNRKHVHPRQCVRLKKKPKPQEKGRIRARIEFCEADRALVKCIVFDRLGQQLFDKHTMRAGVTPDGACLSEIREGEFITSKAKLAEAWDKNVYIKGGDVSEAKDSESFRIFCKALGVE